MNWMKELVYRLRGDFTTERLISMEKRMQQKKELTGVIGYID